MKQPEAESPLVRLEEFANEQLHLGHELILAWVSGEERAGRRVDRASAYQSRLEAFISRPIVN